MIFSLDKDTIYTFPFILDCPCSDTSEWSNQRKRRDHCKVRFLLHLTYYSACIDIFSVFQEYL